MIKYKFKRKEKDDFWDTLRSRVNEYFKDNELDKDANALMERKTIALFTLYLTPYFLLIFAGITNYWILMALWVVMGLGKAFIGTAVMHDSVHGAYYKNKNRNWLITWSATLIGVDKLIWKIQHNVIHHTYTNIEDTDEDILPRFFFRFSEHQPKKWFHRFQHIYAPVFYCVPMLEWLTTKDFAKAIEYRQRGFIKKGREFRIEFTKIIGRKLLYYIVFIIIPILMIDIPIGASIAMIIGSNAVAGIMLALIFQPAHVVPLTDFVKQEEEDMESCWASHQLYTTTNFGMYNPILTWLVGGLNFQIEHHLFPDVCHIHYPQLATIVQKTSKEYGLPYHSFPSFRAAVAGHFGHLKEMGRSTQKLQVQGA
ncbi:fatty acid desaturase family protein [Reichenbachiella ulvae]|uniref:Acyl-CoA desaturase n=1 Tax=Reichenbachiella ulvae TaxID=2980104 RepID=A0ABT3CVW5_9BACT|nr:acyl-CoA desaturase [Reichenbachiella ulvae]MCV9387630.1 acyl-CoA desaturase [Reichenbachiella ulvae]